MMTDDHRGLVPRLERLAADATEGPWEADLDREAVATERELQMICRMDLTGLDGDARWTNCEFIAASRSAIPLLCETIRELVGHLDEAVAQLAEFGMGKPASGVLLDRAHALLEER